MARTLSHPLHKVLARFLLERRKSAGFTQAELAKRLDRPQSFVADVERGERRVDVVELLNFAEALGFDAAGVVRNLREEKLPPVDQ